MLISRPLWMARLHRAWKQTPIIWLCGVRRVGKTSLVKSLPSEECHYVNCDLPVTIQQTADPELFYANIRKPIVIFDEIHQLPDPSRLLKIGADQFPELRLIATGSSTLAASRKFKDTLTGRKRIVRLCPVIFPELESFNHVDLQRRLLRGGLPEILLASHWEWEFFSEWLDSYYARDIQTLYRIAKRDSFIALLNLLLQQSGGLLDITSLSRKLQISRPTVMNYLEAYQTTHALHLLRPFHGGRAREWTHQPKAYAFDTGFICYANGWNELRPDDCGHLWEHLVLDVLLTACDSGRVHFWRDKQLREVDFVVATARDTCDAIECKWRDADLDVRNLAAFRQAYPRGRNFLVTPRGGDPYAIRKQSLEVTCLNPSRLMEIYDPAGGTRHSVPNFS